MLLRKGINTFVSKETLNLSACRFVVLFCSFDFFMIFLSLPPFLFHLCILNKHLETFFFWGGGVGAVKMKTRNHYTHIYNLQVPLDTLTVLYN